MASILRAPVFVNVPANNRAEFFNGTTWKELPIGQGAVGPQGPKGDTGSVGPQGPKGDTGPAGTTPTLPSKTSTRTLTAAQAFPASTWTNIALNSSAASTTDISWPSNGIAQIQTTGTYLVVLAFTTDLTSAVSGRITVNGAVVTGSTFGGTAAFKSGGTISTTLNLTAGQQVSGSIWSAAAGNISADNPGASTLARLSLQRLLVS